MVSFVLTKCCYCLHLRKGIIGFGFLWAVLSAGMAFLFGYAAYEMSLGDSQLYVLDVEPTVKPGSEDFQLNMFHNLTVFDCLIWTCYFLASLLLICGAAARRPGLLIPWLLVVIVAFVLYVYSIYKRLSEIVTGKAAYSIYMLGPEVLFFGRLIVFVLQFYFSWHVTSLYKILMGNYHREDDKII